MECLGRFVGISETVGNAITFKILTEERKIIRRSVVRSATKPGAFQNLRANAKAPRLNPKEPNANLLIKGETIPVVISEKARKDEAPQGKSESTCDGESDGQPESGEPTQDTDTEKKEETMESAIHSAMEHIVKQGGSLPTLMQETSWGEHSLRHPMRTENRSVQRSTTSTLLGTRHRTESNHYSNFDAR